MNTGSLVEQARWIAFNGGHCAGVQCLFGFNLRARLGFVVLVEQRGVTRCGFKGLWWSGSVVFKVQLDRVLFGLGVTDLDFVF